MFVRDFIISQLVGEDIDEIYPLNDAMNRLESLLTSSGLAEPEPRLLGQLGQEAYTSCYYVGIYSNKELIGRGRWPLVVTVYHHYTPYTHAYMR